MPFIDRTRFLPELQANPALVQRLADMVRGEVGLGRDPTLERIQLETAFNRAEARGIPLEQALKSVSDSPAKGYYASDTYSRPATPQQLQYFKGQVLDPVLNGSNEGFNKFGFTPTGNASQMGFAGRRAANGVYSNYSWYSGKPGVGEMYVTERPDAKWASLQNTNTQLAQNAQQPSIWDNPQAFKPEPYQVAQEQPHSIWDSVPGVLKGGLVSPANAGEAPPMSFAQNTPQSLFNDLGPKQPDPLTAGGVTPAQAALPPPTAPLGQGTPFADRFSPSLPQSPNNYAPSSLLNTSAPPSSPFDQMTQGASGLQPWQVAGPNVYNNPLGSNPLMLPQINVAPAPTLPPPSPIARPPQPSQASPSVLTSAPMPMPMPRPSSDIFAQQVYGTNPTMGPYTTPQDFNLQEQAMKTGFAPWLNQNGPANPLMGQGNPLSQLFSQGSLGKLLGALNQAPISASSNIANSLAIGNSVNPNVPQSGPDAIKAQADMTAMDPNMVQSGGLLNNLLGSLNGMTLGDPLSSLFGGGNMMLPDISMPMMSMGDMGAMSPASFDFGFVG